MFFCLNIFYIIFDSPQIPRERCIFLEKSVLDRLIRCVFIGVRPISLTSIYTVNLIHVKIGQVDVQKLGCTSNNMIQNYMHCIQIIMSPPVTCKHNIFSAA